MTEENAVSAEAGDLDLEALKTRYAEARQECKEDPWHPWAGEDLFDLMLTEFPALIAAVEALRERVAEVQKSRPDPNDFESLTQHRNSWRRAAEAAEARVTELERALEGLHQVVMEAGLMGCPGYQERITQARAALARAKALVT